MLHRGIVKRAESRAARPAFAARVVARSMAAGLLLGSCVFAGAGVAADEYLSELDAEAAKVEARRIDGEAGTNTVEAPAEVAPPAFAERDGATRDVFESLLKSKYLGTFGFYKKLPERSRQEIFLEYQHGAAMADVRRKIIDRLLQR